ncbi:glutathione S-transferase N-terminal domain-containing protein [Massilia sp. IC2-477]|uniref:glutathione S-transferase family protein n=1 Tax=Massilia sp. IC2-477 TaxID=2887198 RepID=UPI001D10CC9B|nr:glutathione S-transferase N-terminal domain-containing protein [Massilia sp. IC2-477]MCC2956594.1 glutathione S-transferase N-terminal domain-containing protein [Massilia sp. IC2-477]
MTTTAITLHGTALSGHTHRVQLLLHMLQLPYRFIDAPASVRQSEAFRGINPLGQIPVLQDGELVLADSNAILVYLAKRYAPGSGWLPEDPVGAAQVQRWLSLAAGEIAFGPAKARVTARWGDTGMPQELMHKLADKVLGFMEAQLARQDFLAGPAPTLADLACYSYVAHAPEGGVSLAPYPQLRAWIARVQSLPHFVPMPED